MSWLNNSLNSIKGQLTTLAQEVLAETAGPGDDEYVARQTDASTALEVLSDTQKENEQLNRICADKDVEIAILRKQITELQNKISDSGGGGNGTAGATAAASTASGRTSKSPEQSVTLEDSWCWEPENVKSDNDHSSETSSGNGAEMVNITLEEVPLGRDDTTKKSKRNQRFSPEHTAELQRRVQQLEEENKQLNMAMEELDMQHNQAIQKMLELKTEMQVELSAVSKDYAALKKEHAENFINGELELGRLKKQCEQLEVELTSVKEQNVEVMQKNQNCEAELKKSISELADLQLLLEKKDKDNVELIERIKDASKSNDQAIEERIALQMKLDEMTKLVEELRLSKEKKNSESSTTGSSSKQSDDEFIVVRGEGDNSSTEPTTPPSKEELKDKIVQLENKLSTLNLERETEKELSESALNEQRQKLEDLKKELQVKGSELLEIQAELQEQREKNEQLKEHASEAVIAKEKLKILTEEKEKIELEIKKLKELVEKASELEKRLLISEQEKEALQLETESLRMAKERLQELEQKMQTMILENQQLKLNAEAETETLNNSAELEDKLKALAEDNESMRLELEAIAQNKFSQMIAEEKCVTDLDADEEPDEAFDYDKVRDLLTSYFKQEMNKENMAAAGDNDWIAKTYKALRDRLWQVDSLEKSLARMSEDLLDLRDNKLVWDHEKKTLEADISQYILQCDELMKNNEILLNELENYKRNKLETISENNEENLLMLESQLEECTKLNRTLEDEYAELNEKLDELEREKLELLEKLRETQYSNESLQKNMDDYKLQLETLELEKCNLQFEFNEWKTNEQKGDEASAQLLEAEGKCSSLESQLERLSKDHADLVAAMQAQKNSLMESHKRYEELERQHREQELAAKRTKVEIGANETILKELTEEAEAKNSELLRERKELNDLREQVESKNAELLKERKEFTELRRQNELKLEELQQDILAKDIIAESIKSEHDAMKSKVEKLEKLRDELQALQCENSTLQQQSLKLSSELKTASANEESLRSALADLKTQINDLKTLQTEHEKLQSNYEELQARFDAQSAELAALPPSQAKSNDESVARIAQLEAELLATADLQKSLDSLNFEKQEMIKALQQKHAENMQYYMEIQRMQPIIVQLQEQLASATNTEKPCTKCPDLKAELNKLKRELEKQNDQINFLKEKSDILTTNLLTEQTNQKLVQAEKAEVVEQNAVICKDLERLREHLLEIEELHTQETMEMQQELEETKSQMLAMQEQVSKSSNAYTSASIRANQQAETLQAQYALVVQQRDELVAKLSLAEDRESKNQAALCNLQCALEQFQNDKENDIKACTQRIRKELQDELAKKAQLQAEINTLNQKLADANQGLFAANRLSDQLEACQLNIAALREEVDTLKTQKHTVEEKLRYSESSQTDKIEKSLIKSLLIGYVVSGNPNDKTQVLRMISSVLDFTQSESDKVGLNKQQTSWLGAILGGGGSGAGTHSRDNLVQAFVQFLEQESQPKVNQNEMPNLLNMTQGTGASTTGPGSTSSRRTSVASNSGSGGLNATNVSSPTPIPIQPLLLHSNLIDEFAPSRNSSSILKDILSDT